LLGLDLSVILLLKLTRYKKINNNPSDEQKTNEEGLPDTEFLKNQYESAEDEAKLEKDAANDKDAKKDDLKEKPKGKLRKLTYRPSHKATFIGLTVVAVILAINIGVIAFVLRGQRAASNKAKQNEVTISPAVLSSLGVSRNSVGSDGTVLTIGPDTNFGGTVTVKGNTSISGQLRLNSKFSANDASLANLQAGKVSIDQVNINGDGTISNLKLRKDLSVVGVTRLQGTVTISQLTTINNNLNVAGNLAVGGLLSAQNFQANNLTSGSTLTIGGHVITSGSAPNVGRGPAAGSNGTVSISGNDSSGTVAVNTGSGAGNGILVQVAFRSQYGRTPHVVVTPVGRGVGSFYITRTAGGFSIGVSNALSPGGYAFDYVVME
jgi:hypothetical protein